MALKSKVCAGFSGVWRVVASGTGLTLVAGTALAFAAGSALAQPGSVAEVVSPEDEDRPADKPATDKPASDKPAKTQPADAPAQAPEAAAAPAPGPAAAGEGRPEDQLPADPEVGPARDAYNAGRYEEAAQRFLALCQRHPALPALYRALARSRTWAGDHGGAVLAYETYLAAAPEAGDRVKIGAERDLARRKAEGEKGVPKQVPGAAQLAKVLPRARQGKFTGPEGAFGALDAALAEGWFGPRQIEVGEQLAATLSEASRRALEAWWLPAERVEAADLDQLAEAWAAQAPRRAPTPVERQLEGGIRGLSLLAKDQAAQAAEVLAPVAPGDPRLRFAQALALVSSGQDAEAAALLDALAQAQSDARIDALRGLVHNRLGQAEKGQEALEAALARP